MWHGVADALAARFEVVAIDLRGYGDSSRPAPDPEHLAHSKRCMAADALSVMAQLGHARFDVCAHDRGARVAHRLAGDHPQAVRRLMLLDIAPTLAMYEGTTEAFARAYRHWFLLIQPAPLPERLLERDPAFYLRSVTGGRHAGLAVFDPRALAEYERCVAQPGSAASVCEDYRADVAAGQRLGMPVRVLWGRHGAIESCFDAIGLWRERADDVSGRAVDCGHYIAEERPAELLVEMLAFFVA